MKTNTYHTYTQKLLIYKQCVCAREYIYIYIWGNKKYSKRVEGRKTTESPDVFVRNEEIDKSRIHS